MLNRSAGSFFKIFVAAYVLLGTCVSPMYGADARRGQMLFSSNCEMCHPGGLNSLVPEKPLRGAAFAKKYPLDTMIFNVVRKGIPQTVMSPFPPQRLDDEQVRDIVAFVRSMTPQVKSASKKPVTAPPKIPAKKAPTKPTAKNGSAKNSNKPSTNCTTTKSPAPKKPVR